MKTVEMETSRHSSTQGARYTFSHQPRLTARSAHWLYPLSLLLVVTLYGAGSSLSAANSLAASDTVFRFQSKMAQRGHVASQYALAYMYESRQGTDKDLTLATDWYQQAAQQGFDPAKDRLVYIDILNNGYQPQQHQQWLLKLKQTADDYDYKHQGESAFLLAQLYAAGLAVNKSLSTALKYLHLANAANVIGSDSEIRRVEAELDELRASYAGPDKAAAKSTPQSGKTTATAKPQQPINKPAESTANKPADKPANKPADKPRTATGTADTKNTQIASSVARPHAAPAAKQDSKVEQQESHPMQVICSGWQRLNSACR